MYSAGGNEYQYFGHYTNNRWGLFQYGDNDLNNVLSLINIYNTEIILDNYTKVKDYITELDINFQSFLQYGSGSKKHSTWLNNLVNGSSKSTTPISYKNLV